MTVFLELGRRVRALNVDSNIAIWQQIRPHLGSLEHCYVLCNGHLVTGEALPSNDAVYHIVPRVCGGKGGFGSMLRSIGAQIEKTTSREACRDLSGRRMRDINNEKKLKEWLAKNSNKEESRAERRRRKLEEKLTDKKHVFDDPEYHEQKATISENIEEAIAVGLTKDSGEASTSGTKRSTTSDAAGSRKKFKDWKGMEIDSDISLSDSDSDEDCRASPGDLPNLAAVSHNESEVSPSNLTNPSVVHEGQASSHTLTNQNAETRKLSADGNGNSDKTNGTQSCDSSLTEASDKETTGSNTETTNNSNADTRIEESNDKAKDKAAVSVEDCETVEELMSLGLECLKTALVSRGLKCGGTLQERAERLLAVKGVAPEHIDPSLLASTKGKGKGKGKQSKNKTST